MDWNIQSPYVSASPRKNNIPAFTPFIATWRKMSSALNSGKEAVWWNLRRSIKSRAQTKNNLSLSGFFVGPWRQTLSRAASTPVHNNLVTLTCPCVRRVCVCMNSTVPPRWLCVSSFYFLCVNHCRLLLSLYLQNRGQQCVLAEGLLNVCAYMRDSGCVQI